MCDYDDVCVGEATKVRGDLLLCDDHARLFPPNVSAYGPGWVKCSVCGYDRPVGVSCGEPCL